MNYSDYIKNIQLWFILTFIIFLPNITSAKVYKIKAQPSDKLEESNLLENDIIKKTINQNMITLAKKNWLGLNESQKAYLLLVTNFLQEKITLLKKTKNKDVSNKLEQTLINILHTNVYYYPFSKTDRESYFSTSVLGDIILYQRFFDILEWHTLDKIPQDNLAWTASLLVHANILLTKGAFSKFEAFNTEWNLLKYLGLTHQTNERYITIKNYMSDISYYWNEKEWSLLPTAVWTPRPEL